jgi:hypothetical protein
MQRGKSRRARSLAPGYHARRVRRVVLVLLALALAPSTANAAWYRCAYDGMVRSACCCPSSAHGAKPNHPAAQPSLRAACCCTVTQVTRAEPPGRTGDVTSAPANDGGMVTAAAWPRLAWPGRGAVAAIARPRAQDPPDTLFHRHCSLLL